MKEDAQNQYYLKGNAKLKDNYKNKQREVTKNKHKTVTEDKLKN